MAEEVIVDGVDVSECGFFEAFDCNLNPYDNGGCRNHNCNYKRFKRAEQKLEKIKDYCSKNKVAGWIDVEGIIEIIEGKEDE